MVIKSYVIKWKNHNNSTTQHYSIKATSLRNCFNTFSYLAFQSLWFRASHILTTCALLRIVTHDGLQTRHVITWSWHPGSESKPPPLWITMGHQLSHV